MSNPGNLSTYDAHTRQPGLSLPEGSKALSLPDRDHREWLLLHHNRGVPPKALADPENVRLRPRFDELLAGITAGTAKADALAIALFFGAPRQLNETGAQQWLFDEVTRYRLAIGRVKAPKPRGRPISKGTYVPPPMYGPEDRARLFKSDAELDKAAGIVPAAYSAAPAAEPETEHPPITDEAFEATFASIILSMARRDPASAKFWHEEREKALAKKAAAEAAEAEEAATATPSDSEIFAENFQAASSAMVDGVVDEQETLYENTKGWGNIATPILKQAEGLGELVGNTVGLLSGLSPTGMNPAVKEYWSDQAEGVKQLAGLATDAASGDAAAAGQIGPVAVLGMASVVATKKLPSLSVSDLKVNALIAERKALAEAFYREAGFNEKRIADHLRGIDFTQPVDVITLPKGSEVIQYQVPGAPMGSYFSPLGTAGNTLGFYTSGRVATTFTSSRDIPVLRSTAASTTDDWSMKEYGWRIEAPGGGTQYFDRSKAWEAKE